MRYFSAALLALALCTPASAGTLVTNDGSFVGAGQCPTLVLTPTLTIGTTAQVIAAPANPNQQIHICQWSYGVQGVTSTTGVFLSYGTGSNCATGNTVLDSATLFDGAGFTIGEFVSPWALYYLTVPAGAEVCLLQSGTGAATGYTGAIKYAIF